MPLEPGSRVGPYDISGPLGAGGMGEVYRATDTNLGRQVAIKVLPAFLASDVERLARFEREAKTLAALNHPNIAAIYGLERTGSTIALVMELVEGPTLADRIAHGVLPLEDALPIATQITDALAAAHDQGIVHRDLKPANIKVRPDGMVKVLDFGLAKTIEPAGASTLTGGALSLSPTIMSPAMTEVGMLLGTAAYMSPEQARGRNVDKRADIWAFGCVLFEMVTGRRAFGGDDVTETIAAVMRDQPDLTLAPIQIRRALARCFEKDPRKRLRDIGDVWALIDNDLHVRDLPVGATPAWRRVLPWALVAAATIVAIVMAVSHLTETHVAPRPVRFQLQIPNEAGGSIPTMSPDGTFVTYRAAGQIWVRDLNSLESRPVASTDRPVGRLFWSADSRFVMYGAAGKLLRIAAAGGSPEVLRDIPQVVAGGFGLPDGGFVVSGVTGRPGGGDTVRIDSSGEHALSGIPGQAWLEGGVSLLPDGKRFVYSMSEPEASRGVYVAAIDGATAPVRLLPEASDAAYVPSVTDSGEGYLLLRRQDTLVALPVDAAQLRPHGEPVVLAKSVGKFTASASDSFVYRGNAGRRLTWYDRQGSSTGTAGSLAPYLEVALSPDASRVVVVRADGPTTWVHQFSSESSVKAAPTLGVVVKPFWAPKGDRLTLLHANRTLGAADIVTIVPGGSGEQLVLRTPGVVYPTSWSRDGQWLLYTNVDPRTKEDLWVVPMATGGAGKPQPFLVTDNKETDGAFSPDGLAVAYVSDESGTGNVYVRSFPSNGGRKWPVSIGGGYQPRWRADGKELFYISPSGQLMSVAITPGLASPPGRATPLFQTAIYGGGPSINNWYWDVTPDGQRFLINTVVPGNEPSTLNVVLNWQSGLRE